MDIRPCAIKIMSELATAVQRTSHQRRTRMRSILLLRNTSGSIAPPCFLLVDAKGVSANGTETGEDLEMRDFLRCPATVVLYFSLQSRESWSAY